MTEYHQPNNGDVFDMATGRYFPLSDVMASHIFLYRWCHRITRYTSFSDINDVRNGLLLYKPVAWALRHAKMCIEVGNMGVMTFCLLDENLQDVMLADMASELQNASPCGHQPGSIGDETTFGDLDGREVQFPQQSTTRPSKRLLGIHAIAAWVAAKSETRHFDTPVPECNASDVETGKVSFIEAWRNGVLEGAPVSGSQLIFWTKNVDLPGKYAH